MIGSLIIWVVITVEIERGSWMVRGVLVMLRLISGGDGGRLLVTLNWGKRG